MSRHVTLSAATLYAIPFWASRGGTADQITAIVTNAGIGGDTCRFGIYNNTSASVLYPSTIVVDSGVVATNSTGAKAVGISQALTAGNLYWLVLTYNQAGAQFGGFAVGGGAYSAFPALGWTAANPPVAQYGWSIAQAYGALPATFPGNVGTATPMTDNLPALFLRFSA